jgi:hypothetical protein
MEGEELGGAIQKLSVWFVPCAQRLHLSQLSVVFCTWSKTTAPEGGVGREDDCGGGAGWAEGVAAPLLGVPLVPLLAGVVAPVLFGGIVGDVPSFAFGLLTLEEWPPHPARTRVMTARRERGKSCFIRQQLREYVLMRQLAEPLKSSK